MSKLKADAELRTSTAKLLKERGYDTARLNDGTRRLVLITGHRRENFGDGFLDICHAIRDLAAKYPDVDFVYPMHLNPNVRRPIAQVFPKEYSPANVFFIEPLDYLPFVYMMTRSHIILTDSGGIQEEAPSLGKPVLVMRTVTERPEALEAGTIHLVGTDRAKIVDTASLYLDDEDEYRRHASIANPYGDGSMQPHHRIHRQPPPIKGSKTLKALRPLKVRTSTKNCPDRKCSTSPTSTMSAYKCLRT